MRTLTQRTQGCFLLRSSERPSSPAKRVTATKRNHPSILGVWEGWGLRPDVICLRRHIRFVRLCVCRHVVVAWCTRAFTLRFKELTFRSQTTRPLQQQAPGCRRVVVVVGCEVGQRPSWEEERDRSHASSCMHFAPARLQAVRLLSPVEEPWQQPLSCRRSASNRGVASSTGVRCRPSISESWSVMSILTRSSVTSQALRLQK